MPRQIAQGLVDHLADRAQGVLGRNLLLQVDVAEHSVLLLLISTHATYITYLPVERLVPSEIPSTFSAASEAVPLQQTICRVENRRSRCSLPVAILAGLSLRRLNPAWLGSVSCPRSSNRTGGFPASGSRKRLTFSPTEDLPSVSVNRLNQTRRGELLPESV